ncbi:unnamed protein product [Camellia sinensis]
MNRRLLLAINHARTRTISAVLLWLLFLIAHLSISLDAGDLEEMPINPPPAPPAELIGVGVKSTILQPMVVKGGPTDYRMAVELVLSLANNSITQGQRRRMAAFQLCLACKCCVAGAVDPNTCVTMPCCFGIDCQLPNKPFGVCAFVPKTCNCISCSTV